VDANDAARPRFIAGADFGINHLQLGNATVGHRRALGKIRSVVAAARDGGAHQDKDQNSHSSF
jgi:hypothetical protein